MLRRRSLLPLFLALVLALTAVGCAQQGAKQTPAQQPAQPTQTSQQAQQSGGPQKPGGEPIKLGFLSVFSGRISMLGETGFKGAKLAVDEVNASGGILGRPVEITYRDTGGNRDEAVRLARDYILKEKVDFIVDGSSSAESFAVSSAVKQLGKVSIATASESANLTDQKNLHDYIFRAARNTLHDGIAAGLFAGKQPYTKWYTISPDYEYGRSSTDIFVEELKHHKPDVTIVGQSWPKLFEPDYTPHIQKILDAKPEAVYSALWGGDLVAFVQQAKAFGLLDKVKFFTPNLADFLVLKALGNAMPAGIYTGTRFLPGAPDTEANKKFNDNYFKAFGEGPTNWSVQAYQAVFMLKAAVEKAGSTDSKAVAKTLLGLKLPNQPWGDLEIRSSDHQVINYTIGWGVSDPNHPLKVKVEFMSNWNDILQREKQRGG